MNVATASKLKKLVTVGGLLLVLNEIRGIVMAAPVFWTLFQTGNSEVDAVAAIAMLMGILLSVIVPIVLAKRARAYFQSASN
ncbi:hypothetical protein [Tsuneonella suprasediminis]|uniref:hypothetical protein n=1 Tax=Tsuneonella suprasediminis TaxID=2306996 RepID=UPI0010587E45|nr:hypothetical protein [Tsuneonella suprasediminis]